MKKLGVILVLMLTTSFVWAQRPPEPTKQLLIKTYTTFTATTDDTTGYISLATCDLSKAREVAIITIATDSVQATLQFIGRNSQLTKLTDIYTDSISTLGGGGIDWDATTPKTKVTILKGPGVNVLEGCDQLKIGTVFLNASEIGTTAGRTLKHYLWVSWY